jgi:MFS family permease
MRHDPAMRDEAIGQADVRSLALAEPTKHVQHRWIIGLTLATLGMWMANQTPSQVMLALQLQDITPRHKIAALGVVTAVNAVSSALATPFVGALSDRTAHGRRRGGLGRFSGRRHRWTLAMVLPAAVCVGLLAKAGTVVAVALLWFLFGAFQNGEYASLSAAIPDHVPVRQRATVSGWVGMPIALGLVLGTVLVVDVLGQDLFTGYIALAVLMVVLALPFVLFTPDHPLAPGHREPFSWRRVASSYWISPREYPDFGWAWLTRFLTTLAIAMGTLYLLYFLRDAVHYSRLFPGQTAADGLLILILIYTGGVVVASVIGGVISDRSGRRKMLVTVSGLLMAAAALLLTFSETWPAALGAAMLFGIGFGAYIAVDQALITQVLPKARDRAKDLGIINIAIVTPYAIGPAIAAPLVSLAGYPTLFGATAVVAIAAAAGVWRIKSVR